jgi:threonylcarbamoyladenosine tRNA methylthiotransferase MtaB
VVAQVRRLVGNGYLEIVLTGVDLTSWGADLPGAPRLGTLAAAILREVPELARLRLSSIDSIEVDDKLLEIVATDARFMPHLHLSLQHGDNMILKRMKRRHMREDSIRFCEDIRKLRPDMVFGADLIAGFPTEDEAMFENSLAIVEECGLTHLHVFPFSPRPGTPAAKMPQLDRSLVKERAARLRAAGESAWQSHLAAMTGATLPVLVEREGMGRIPQFSPVVFSADIARDGGIVDMHITGHDGAALLGEAVTARMPSLLGAA